MAEEPTPLGMERLDPDTDQWRLAYQTINQHADKVDELVSADRGRITLLESGADTAADGNRAYGLGRVTVGGSRILPGVNVRYSAFPVQTKLADGRILMVWYEATDHITTRDGIVVGSYSEDNGLTWGPKTTFHQLPGIDLRDPTVSTSTDGTVLYLTYIKCTAAEPRDGFFLKRSFDNGATWSAETRIDPVGSNGAGTAPVVELANGVLLAVWFGMADGESFDSCWRAYSPDRGVTWSLPEKFRDGPAAGRSYNEPYAAVHGDDVVIMYRHGEIDQLGITRSNNSGATWSAPAAAFVGTGRPSCTITTNGTLIVVYRDYPGTGAFQHAVMRTSRDLGVTWSPHYVVERADPNWMLYSCPTEVAPGVVMCSTAIENSTTATTLSVRYLLEGGGVSPLGDMAPDVEDRAVQRLSGLATVDSFDRADSASIGWSENGQAWVPVTAGPIISDGALHYSAGAGPHLVITRILSQHMEIEAELSWATSAGLYLVFRYQNSTNYLMLGLETNGTALRLYKVVSGTATQLGSTVTVAAPSGLFHKVKVTAVGDNIRCYFEDALVLTVADATHNTQEWAGIRMGVGATALTHRVRNFVSRRRAGRFA